MTAIWRARIAVARFFLGTGPEGYHYCFRKRTLFVRSDHEPTSSTAVGDAYRVVPNSDTGTTWAAPE